MKSCPSCKRTFPDDAGFCPVDGSALVSASLVPVAGTSDDPRIGQLFCGRYELRRVVADGGMGRVYEGIDRQTKTRIAVKILHEAVARDDVALERFRREYEISRALPHDHIVDVSDFQRDEGSGAWLMVMEFLDGEELRVVLKREKHLSPDRVIRMVAQTAIGLDAAHAKQFVHRDLKPDNIFLCGTREGDVAKILDFGSVKDKNENAKKLTVLGTTIGSPYYMAPEQAQGLETLDARADVFALAAITYETITGSVPFGGTNGPSILLAILTEDPLPPTVKGKGAPFVIPAAIDDVLDVALAKNPAIRTPSVGALADAVGQAYGLTGSHVEWASLSQAELAARLQAAGAGAQAPSAPVATPDPFAVAPGHATTPMASAPPHPAAAEPAAHAHAPVPTTGDGGYGYGGGAMAPHGGYGGAYDDTPAGLGPPGRPAWLVPVLAALGVLLVGGILVILASR